MPKLSRWYVKSALICLLLGSAIAGLSLAANVLPASPAAAFASLQPLSWHLLAVGWATQLIFGVAYWMFPLAATTRAPARPRPAERRGNERLGWAAFALLNAGLFLRAIGEPAVAVWPGSALGALLPLSAVAQVAAIALLVGFTWGRIRSTGR